MIGNMADLQMAVERLAVALALGAAIGFERQWQQKMAGLRTNALVALGSSGFVVFGAIAGHEATTVIAGQVVTGIGFLGAGIILREGFNVLGLNTAATLWCSAMVGTFVGGGQFLPGIAAATLVIVTNLLLRPLVRRLNRRALNAADVETQYTVEVTSKASEEAHVRSLLLHAMSVAGLGLRRIDSEDIPDTPKVTVRAQAVSPARNDSAFEQIVGRLSLEPFVSAAAWQIDRSLPEG
jgi:putative Mg2+ transporter-C (MgtC) family protein